MGKKKITQLVIGGAHIPKMQKIKTTGPTERGAPIPTMQPVQQPQDSGQQGCGQGSSGNQTSGNASGGTDKTNHRVNQGMFRPQQPLYKN